MARENFVLKTLLEKGEVTWSPNGNSMTPKLISGEAVTVKKILPEQVRVGDAVYAKVKGSYYLHLLTAIDETKDRYQISNNHGHVNGWVAGKNVFGVLVKIKDKTVLTDEELGGRMNTTVKSNFTIMDTVTLLKAINDNGGLVDIKTVYTFYNCISQGSLANENDLCTDPEKINEFHSFIDSIITDAVARLYITSNNGILTITPAGKKLAAKFSL